MKFTCSFVLLEQYRFKHGANNYQNKFVEDLAAGTDDGISVDQARWQIMAMYQRLVCMNLIMYVISMKYVCMYVCMSVCMILYINVWIHVCMHVWMDFLKKPIWVSIILIDT